ncbi:MAG: hypothetical protein HZB13_12830 [Acidobacteria bacterium]|nr:hypothetical protein [Acidobacteriota bacterium]
MVSPYELEGALQGRNHVDSSENIGSGVDNFRVADDPGEPGRGAPVALAFCVPVDCFRVA